MSQNRKELEIKAAMVEERPRRLSWEQEGMAELRAVAQELNLALNAVLDGIYQSSLNQMPLRRQAIQALLHHAAVDAKLNNGR